MALRSRSRTATPTSGPGRGPVSDGRTRHRRHEPRSRTRTRPRQASAEALRLRAEALFTERAGEHRESGNAPPGADRDVGAPRAKTAVGLGVAPGWGAREPAVGRVRGGAGATVAEAVLDADANAEADVVIEPDPGVGGSVGPWRERAGLAVRERMPLWLQSRCGLERRSVAALTVVLVAAAVFAVQHFWVGRTQSVRAPEVVRAAAPYGETADADGREPGGPGGRPGGGVLAGDASAGGASAGTVLVVDVSGKVRSPGIHRLPAGSRVEDALRAAGGVRPGASTEGLNRARLLVDGEQVVVGAPAPAAGAGPGGTGAVGAVGAGGVAAGAAPSAPVSLNTATVEQLDTLPGVGPVLAQHIIDYRTQHGGFRSVDELREVNGIGDRRFADLRNLVRP